MNGSIAPPAPVRVEKAVYGGDGLARTGAGEVVFVPFALPGELVQIQPPVQRIETSPERVEPRCIHFGVCGGCQYQMAAYAAQLAMKAEILHETLARAGLHDLPPPQSWPSAEAYGYRNRIRLRLRRIEGAWRLGYSVRGTNEFLPVTMCPIAAPPLWRGAEALLAAATTSRDLARSLANVGEIEFFCDDTQSQLQITLLCLDRDAMEAKGFLRAMEAVQALCPELRSAGAMRLDPRSGRAVEQLANWGAVGLAYRVNAESYWITRGSFFQVNRFLLSTLVDLVCGERSGGLAWDLFAGVGLFSRVLARRFGAVTAVEANPIACADLGRALAKLGSQHAAVQATTLAFLRQAVLQRERPELLVLDPPRAGAGEEACRLLAQLAPPEIVYLSCDPTTLARDLAVLTGAGYAVAELHLIDLFPQTYHLETMAVLRRGVGD